MNNKIVKVYDTITGKMVDVEVSQEVYDAYMRTEWNIHDNNESFYEHEIQFSMLIGGDDGAFENFHEFITDDDPTADYALSKAAFDEVMAAVARLKKADRELIHMIYFSEYTEQECADLLGTTQQNIHKKKKRILSNLYKLMEDGK
ncbi:RNA polymerase sigma factor, sigma-70 family [Ruminococcus sp. YE71]|uniref:sigma factor-like helix-turn-helix DNA-binding protein n=1 Tax=unclassified Ruminococcus TaxID=2608920 RepID=UPI000884B207|nr:MULTISPECIES: sigma factor-like helix-turn-helix DNA-binding protein [unclassified Ruminococcus]SDA31251.1 RNA polymerase sigma factor, sigma-70 family [Ruminococcus sp. YE78]SFW51271.1 RNA polymerase sigma factor, sigma-70 family [Ruminococcus sp. YE71]